MDKLLSLILELNKIRGIPQFLFSGGIDPDSMRKFRASIIEFKKNNGTTKEVDFILDSPGGSPGDAYRIIRTLRNTFETVNIIIPFWAKSAATLLALGGSSIIMGEFGEMGPLDIQIAKERDDNFDYERESALNDEYSLRRIESQSIDMYMQLFVGLHSSKYVPINKNELSKQIFEYLATFYEPILKQINPYKLGEKKRKLLIGEQYASRILLKYNNIGDNRSKMRELIDFLVNGCPEHGFIIDYDEISRYLENVKKSSDISIEYSEVIDKIATVFLKEEEEIDYIGFVEQQKEADV